MSTVQHSIYLTKTHSYLILEYVDGGELFDYVSDNGSLGEEEAVRFFDS